MAAMVFFIKLSIDRSIFISIYLSILFGFVRHVRFKFVYMLPVKHVSNCVTCESRTYRHLGVMKTVSWWIVIYFPRCPDSIWRHQGKICRRRKRYRQPRYRGWKAEATQRGYSGSVTELSRKLISFVIDLLCTDILVAVCHSNVLALLRLVLQSSWRLLFF